LHGQAARILVSAEQIGGCSEIIHGETSRMRTALLVIACLCLWGAPGRAGLVAPDDRVGGHKGLTYFDLMRLVVTDLAPDSAGGEGNAHQIVNYRHIEARTIKPIPTVPFRSNIFFRSKYTPVANAGSL
jgi:hypothetical protein